jgi:hypothetical protein
LIRTRWDCKYSIPPKGAMVRLDQEWYYMAMRTMNVQIVHFSAEKSKECVGSMCHTIERTDIQGYPNC